MDGPIIDSGDRSKTMLLFAGGILATLALVAALVLLWPSGDDDDITATGDTTTTAVDGRATTTVEGALGEPSEQSGTTPPVDDPDGPLNLFTADADAVLAELVEAAGGPTEAIEVLLYPDYAFLAYRDVDNPANIDQRIWRDGEVGDAEPNPIDDRVDPDTQPKLFPLADLDLRRIPQVTADAVGRFDLEVAVTHVIINRFLPFDDRVLIRVYGSPIDGRSGGGYVQYALDGTFVKVVQ